MDFHKIDKNTVQCRMTEEEMNAFGLNIEDFFTDQEKSREFLERIVEMAEEEVGYEVESGMVSMQLMRMPDNSLTITFTDRGEDALQNMLHQIQHLAGMIDDSEAEDIIEDLQKDMENGLDGMHEKAVHNQESNQEEWEHPDIQKEQAQQKEYQKHMREIEKLQREKEKRKLNASKVYEFQCFTDLEQFAEDYITAKNISSKVYRDKAGKYYLLVKKGKLKMEEYQNLCQRLSDYASFCSEQPYVEQYCREHYECIIGKHALKVMREYY